MTNANRLLVEAAASTRRELNVRAERLHGQVLLADRLGRRVAIVRNSDIDAVLGQREALIKVATRARAILARASAGDREAHCLVDTLDAAIAGRRT